MICARYRIPQHLAITCLFVQLVSAFKTFQTYIPNGDRVPDPCDNTEFWGGVGHLVPSGRGRRNPFGEDFHAQGKKWTRKLCQMDSDGDGLTNGQELGDPECVWKPGGRLPLANKISHPGVCEPWNSVQCQARNGWLKCNQDGFDCPATKETNTRSKTFKFPKTQIPARETTYYCQLFDLPVDDDYHLVATEPVLDNTDTVHHILMFGCDPTDDIDPTPVPYQCGMLAHRRCLDIIATWTVGSNGDCLHDNVGFRIGKTGYRTAALQVHWNNPKTVSNTTDSSGLKLYYTPVRRQFDAGMLLVGQEYLEIPPQSSNSPSTVTYSQTCPARCTREMLSTPIYITATVNHMHYQGVSQRIELYRNGTKVRDVTYDRFYHYDNPVIYMFNPPVEVRPGDELRTTCVFQPIKRDTPICFGDGTQDEMCYGFITYYPKQNLPIPWCTARKSTQICDRHLPALNKVILEGCDWRAFRNPLNPEVVKLFHLVLGNCYNGSSDTHTCTENCSVAIATARKNPCLSGDIGSYIISKFRHHHQGFAFLNALFTCDCERQFDNGFCDRRYVEGVLGENAKKMCSARYTSTDDTSQATTTSFSGLCVLVTLSTILINHGS